MSTVGGVAAPHDLNGNLRWIGALPATPDKFMFDHENRLFRTGLCRGDVNGDFAVTVLDLNAVSARFDALEGSAAYDQLADMNHDRALNVLDLSAVGGEFGFACGSGGANTGSGRYVYNGDGLRVRASTKVTGQALVDNDYVWSQGDGLPVVLQDLRTQGGVTSTTTFVYGLDLISATDGAGATSYYLTDGLGSTRALADSAGAVTDTYSYDVYGAVRAQTGTTNNDFRYTGEQADDNANRGLYYLRARHYDPALGRFLSKDPVPLTNRYTYAGGDPANYADPKGECRVEVRLRKGNSSSNGVKGWGVWHHALIVTSDPLTGEKTLHEGLPGRSIRYQTFPEREDPGAFTNHRSARIVYHDSGSCDDLNAQFSAAGRSVDDANIPYAYFTQNSNSFARELLEAVGLPQEKPRGWAPGWNKNLIGDHRQRGPVRVEPIPGR